MGADFGDIVGAGLVQFGLPYCMYRRGRRVNERKFRATENAVLNSLLSPFYAPFVEKSVSLFTFPWDGLRRTPTLAIVTPTFCQQFPLQRRLADMVHRLICVASSWHDTECRRRRHVASGAQG